MGIITDFSRNKYIIKGSTGIGGTTSILEETNQNIIIISPLTGMIASKEQKNNDDHQFFIYGKSKHTWNNWHVASQERNCVVNTTPEQILELKKNRPDLYNKVIKCNFFIDEFDIMAIADYRHSLRQFYQVIFNEIEGGLTISTATPVYKHLDIPASILARMDIFRIKRQEEAIKKLKVEPLNNVYNFVKKERALGRKVILITNDFNRHKDFVMNPEFSAETQTLTGDKLYTKIAKARPHTLEEDEMNEGSILDPTKSIYILSKKYVIGYDIPFDASIGILADQLSKVDNIVINDIVQGYGRIRGKVLNGTLFYRSIGSSEDIFKLEREIRSTDKTDEYLENNQEKIITVLNHLTYSDLFEQEINKYGFELEWNNEPIAAENQSLAFTEKYTNLVTQDDYLLRKQLQFVYSNINGDDKDYSGFNKADLLLYATAYMAKRTDNQYLIDYEPQRYQRLLNIAKTFIDINDTDTVFDKISKNRISTTTTNADILNGLKCNDSYSFASHYSTDDAFLKAVHIINHLYCIQLVEDDEIDETTLAVMRGFEIASEVVIIDFKKYLEKIYNKPYDELIIDRKILEEINTSIPSFTIRNMFNHTPRNIKNALTLDGLHTHISQDIFNQIMKKSEDIKASLKKNKNGLIATISSNTYSLDKQKQNHGNYILSLLSLMCAGHMWGFKTTKKDNRDFNTITKCTRQLRSYTPYHMYQADISSAFATFVDEMIGSNIADKVYVNIMNKNKVNRGEAKKMYNSSLNDASRNRHDLYQFFISCGYSKNQTNNLVDIVKFDKGSFYRSMTIKEEQAIQTFKDINKLPSYIRCHDAVFWIALDNKEYINNFGSVKFDIKKV